MDPIQVHSIITVISFVIFIVIVVWAYSDRSKAGFEQAARLPFDEDDEPIGYGERK